MDEIEPVTLSEDRLFTPEEASELLKVSTSQLAKWRTHGGGPKYIKFPGDQGAVRYRLTTIWEWVSTLERASTSDPGGAPSLASGLLLRRRALAQRGHMNSIAMIILVLMGIIWFVVSGYYHQSQ